MLKIKVLTTLLFIQNTFSTGIKERKENHYQQQGEDKYKITTIANLPELADESSGLAIASSNGDSLTLWTHNDSGGEPELYEIDMKGNLVSTLTIPHTSNKDWEDLAKDKEGNIYIGDFGNNLNIRKDLRIYKVSIQPDTIITDTISFHYEDQTSLPVPVLKNQRNFDCEAFFWYKNHLYLFSKNRGDKSVKIYQIPDTKGEHTARIVDSTNLQAMITAADINISENEFALLGYGKIYLFKITDEEINFSSPSIYKNFPTSGQAEGIVYINDHDLVISNEQGKLFLMEKKKKNNIPAQ